MSQQLGVSGPECQVCGHEVAHGRGIGIESQNDDDDKHCRL